MHPPAELASGNSVPIVLAHALPKFEVCPAVALSSWHAEGFRGGRTGTGDLVALRLGCRLEDGGRLERQSSESPARAVWLLGSKAPGPNLPNLGWLVRLRVTAYIMMKDVGACVAVFHRTGRTSRSADPGWAETGGLR